MAIETKRYMVFAGVAYYPSGGIHDLVGTYDTIDSKIIHADNGNEFCTWLHIYDLKEERIVIELYDVAGDIDRSLKDAGY